MRRERARSPAAKQRRALAILDAARTLATERSVRVVTLTDIATAVGLHKSALLRYFESREQIVLALAAQERREWSTALREELSALVDTGLPEIAATITRSLVSRPLLCDLLAHVPLTVEAEEVEVVATVAGISERTARDAVTAATGLAAALTRTTGDVEPQLMRIVTAVLHGV